MSGKAAIDPGPEEDLGAENLVRARDSATGPPPALLALRRTCDNFLQLQEQRHTPVELLHATAASMHRFAITILGCERAGLDRDALLPDLAGVRQLHAQSPFVHRLQSWPRGYAGDFETVESLCDATNRAPAGTVPWAIEEYALQSPVAQQHRNKVALQARMILSTLAREPHARIASIGCGGCRDLGLIQEYVARLPGTFVLVDSDPDALQLARERLPQLARRCTFVVGSVPRVLSKVMADGPFDLVVAGGLFDYLPDQWAVATLKAVQRILAPGGRLLLSNIASGNPFRPWLEYLADWRLIERNEADMRALIAKAGIDGRVHMYRDTTQLALMVDLGIADCRLQAAD